MGFFNYHLMFFLPLKLFVFKNISQIFLCCFFLFCLIVTEPSYRMCFVVKYKLFYLVSVLSDAILSLLVSFF